MAYQALDTTAGAGDTGKVGGDKINANFVELYARNAPLKNTVSAANPTTANDSGSGYAIGSQWLNSGSWQAFTCLDATAAAAKWRVNSVTSFSNYVVGKYYPTSEAGTSAGGAMAVDTMYFTPFMAYEHVSFQTVGFRVNVAGTNMLLGLFATDPATNLPSGVPLAYSANISATVGNKTVTLNTSVTLEPGLIYWWGAVVDTATTVLITLAVTSPQHTILVGTLVPADVAPSPGITWLEAAPFVNGIATFSATPASVSTAAGGRGVAVAILVAGTP